VPIRTGFIAAGASRGGLGKRRGSVPSEQPKSLLISARMSDRRVTPLGRLTAICLLVAAVVTIGLVIAGALHEIRSPVPQLASHK
jgi:hypothetical protein